MITSHSNTMKAPTEEVHLSRLFNLVETIHSLKGRNTLNFRYFGVLKQLVGFSHALSVFHQLTLGDSCFISVGIAKCPLLDVTRTDFVSDISTWVIKDCPYAWLQMIGQSLYGLEILRAGIPEKKFPVIFEKKNPRYPVIK